MKLNNKEKSSLTAPKVSNNEVQRAIEKIYEDLNELKDATNKSDISSSQDYEGKVGDIKLVKTSNDSYELHIKGQEGWVSAKTGEQETAYTLIQITGDINE